MEPRAGSVIEAGLLMVVLIGLVALFFFLARQAARPATGATGRRLAIALTLVGAMLAGCAGAASPAPGTTDGASASLEPTPSPAASPTPEPTRPGQTDTAWGLIWDGLPQGFPAYPGARPTDTGGGPATAVLDVGTAAPATVAAFYKSALEDAGYSTDGLTGPLEDGSWSLDSSGDAGCQIQVTVAPMGTSTIVTILFGAYCAFG
jgi:hypothetical protein